MQRCVGVEERDALARSVALSRGSIYLGSSKNQAESASRWAWSSFTLEPRCPSGRVWKLQNVITRGAGKSVGQIPGYQSGSLSLCHSRVTWIGFAATVSTV